MVVIKQYSTAQISGLNNITGRVLYDVTNNILKYNDSTSYNNILVKKDENNNLAQINNLNITGNFGLNTTAPDKQLEINSTTGDCLRLTYNDNNGTATNYTDFVVSNLGDLSITPSGGDITLNSTLTTTDINTFSNTTDSSSTTTGAVIIAGGVGIAKKVYIGGTLSTTGATTLSSTLGVTGATTLSSTLGVTAATTLSSTLNVTGITTLSNNLSATGINTFSNVTDASSTTTGAVIISGGVGISKKLYVGTTLNVSGATTLSNTLNVAGATTLSSSLGVTGAVNLSNNLTISGATSCLGSLSVGGAFIISSVLDSSSTSTGAFVVGGGVGIAKKLYVGSDLNIAGNTTLTGSLSLTDAATLSNTVDISGATNIYSTLGVSGETTLASSLSVTGSTSLSSTLNVSGNTTLLGNVGIGTTIASKKLEINSTTGDCLRLTYNDSDGSASTYVDLSVSSNGDYNITSSSGNVNIPTHNGSTTGLELNNVLVTATADELNYTDTTPGYGTATKAMVLDSNRDIVNINYFEAANGVFVKPNVANNTIDYPLSLIVTPNTTASVGLGIGIEFNSVNDNNDIYNAGYINYVSTDITNNAETGYFDFKLANGGSIDSILTVANNGVVTATSLVETSDIRVKENIEDTITNYSLKKILDMKVKTFNFINDTKKIKHTGLIAQEVKDILPELINISKKDNLNDFHSIHYTEIVPHLINCIKELYKEIDILKEKY